MPIEICGPVGRSATRARMSSGKVRQLRRLRAFLAAMPRSAQTTAMRSSSRQAGAVLPAFAELRDLVGHRQVLALVNLRLDAADVRARSARSRAAARSGRRPARGLRSLRCRRGHRTAARQGTGAARRTAGPCRPRCAARSPARTGPCRHEHRGEPLAGPRRRCPCGGWRRAELSSPTDRSIAPSTLRSAISVTAKMPGVAVSLTGFLAARAAALARRASGCCQMRSWCSPARVRVVVRDAARGRAAARLRRSLPVSRVGVAVLSRRQRARSTSAAGCATIGRCAGLLSASTVSSAMMSIASRGRR